MRRELLRRSGMGMGAVALAGLLSDAGPARRAPPRPTVISRANPTCSALVERPEPALAQAAALAGKSQAGRPSVHERRAVARRHVRPEAMLDRHNGKPVPTNLPTERKTGAAMGSPFKFKKYGQSGIEVSDLFAHTAGMIDDICVIRSMHADVPNHEPSLMLMNCGEARQARPCVGLVGALRSGDGESEPARVSS